MQLVGRLNTASELRRWPPAKVRRLPRAGALVQEPRTLSSPVMPPMDKQSAPERDRGSTVDGQQSSTAPADSRQQLALAKVSCCEALCTRWPHGSSSCGLGGVAGRTADVALAGGGGRPQQACTWLSWSHTACC